MQSPWWSLIFIPPQLVVTNAFVIKLSRMSSIINQYNERNQPNKTSEGFLNCCSFFSLLFLSVSQSSPNQCSCSSPSHAHKRMSPLRRGLVYLSRESRWQKSENQGISLFCECNFQRHSDLKLVFMWKKTTVPSFQSIFFLLRLLGVVKHPAIQNIQSKAPHFLFTFFSLQGRYISEFQS